MGWQHKATIVLALVAGAIALGAVAIPITNHPTFCASCHTIAPSYESWVKSSHREVTRGKQGNQGSQSVSESGE